MAREQPLAILDPLRRLIDRQTGSSLTDAQLLANFVGRGDAPSFEVLVWRHGAMVLAVCRRVLRDAHEAEDAFQATFLVFARKAGSVGRGEVVAAWLHKVAYRVALRLRAASAKRPARVEPADDVPAPEPTDGAEWRDLRPVLDAEIAELPEKYRAPFVLCHLEGLTNEEAAAQLGCPKGTVLSRLSRGRERLRARLTRRGLALTATTFALALSQNAVSATVPAALVSPTVEFALSFKAGQAMALVPTHVVSLAEGVLKTMTLIKVKIATTVLVLVAALGTGLAWGAGTDPGDSPAPSAPKPVPVEGPPARPAVAAPVEGPRERPAAAAPVLTGKVVSVAKDGKSFTVETPSAEIGKEPTKTEVTFGAKAAIRYTGVGRNGAKPTVGYNAQVAFEANSKTVAATVNFSAADGGLRLPDVTGTVVKGKDNTSVTLEVRPKEGAERGAERPKETIPFDEKTVLSFSNVEKDGATITAGYDAMVWYADDGKTAGKVQFNGHVKPGRPDETRPDVVGKVTRIDGRTLVVQVPVGGRSKDPVRTTITLTLGAKTPTTFWRVPTDGAKIAADLLAHVWLTEGTKDTVAKVVFFGTVPERWTFVSGKVAAVAQDGNSFTLEAPAAVPGQGPNRTEIKLTTKTKVAFSVGPDEAKIAVGQIAQVWLLDGSTDTALHAVFAKLGDRDR